MNILMWVGIAITAIFGGLGLCVGVTTDYSRAAKCYRVAAAGAVLACVVFSYQFLGTPPSY